MYNYYSFSRKKKNLFETSRSSEKKKAEGWTMVFHPPKNNLIGHTGDVISHTGSGWNDVLGKIRDAHPGSTIQTKY